jgi:hypothetical protein
MDYLVNDPSDQRLMAEVRDERLIWSGRPAQGLRLRRSDRVMIPFSLVWCGFALFFEYMAVFFDPDGKVIWPLAIFGGFFVLIGIYLVIGRFFIDAAKRKHTLYGLTDQRALIVTGGGKNVRSLKLSALPEITMTERPDGSGDVRLGSAVVSNEWDQATESWANERKQPPTLEMIPNVREVYDLCLRAQAGKG